jgi:GT2 family glycosyltransferase
MDGTPIIQAVVVIYKRQLMECESVRSLLEVQMANPKLFGSLRVLIQDNSPTPQPVPEELAAQSQYRHCAGNPGLADAYNCGMAAAKEKGIEWLLLLDQDTQVSTAYLVAVLDAIAAKPESNICAFVPKLFMGNRIIGPHRIRAYSTDIIATTFAGVSREMLLPFNSGAVLSLSALDRVGGFDAEFPLDYLDNITFARLYRAGFFTCVVDVGLQHSLSLLDLERGGMSPGRYKEMLTAQWKLYGEIHMGMRPILHRLRLLLRGVKQYLLVSNKEYSAASFASVFAPIPKRALRRR